MRLLCGASGSRKERTLSGQEVVEFIPQTAKLCMFLNVHSFVFAKKQVRQKGAQKEKQIVCKIYSICLQNQKNPISFLGKSFTLLEICAIIRVIGAFFGIVNERVRGDRHEDQKRDDRHAAGWWSGIETWGFDC